MISGSLDGAATLARRVIDRSTTGKALLVLSRRRGALLVPILAAFISFGALERASAASAASRFDQCLTWERGASCRTKAVATETPTAPLRPNGSWKLMRAVNPHGGPDAVSIVHAADISRSDADLAGLMLRCAQGGGIEALIIVFDPRAPSSRPWVKVRAADTEEKFEARIVPPFTALLLPPEAAALLTGRWRTSDEIAIEIEAEPSPEKGIVSLMGLGPALDELRASCPPQ